MEYPDRSGSFEYEFLIFDVLFYQKYQGDTVSWMEYDYHVRYNCLRSAVDDVLIPFYTSNITDHRFHCSAKLWFSIEEIKNVDNIYKFIETKTNLTRSKKYALKADGIILQPFDTPYIPFKEWNAYNNVQFKWKPAKDLTVDFKIKITSPSTWTLYTKTDQVYNISQPKGKPVPALCYPTKANMRNYVDGDVAEFVYQPKNNPEGNLFNVIRLRNEKSANSYSTIMSTLDIIHNPFNLDTLKQALIAVTNPFPTNNDIREALLEFSKSQLILFSSDMFFDPKEVTKIEEIYNQRQVGETELEFKIFKEGKKGNILDKFTFYYLYNFLKANFPVTRQHTIDILHTVDKVTYRSTYLTINDIYSGNSKVNETKKPISSFTQKLKHKLFNNLVFKLTLSEETKTDRIITLTKEGGLGNLIRTKDRHTYTINDLWKIDLTKVRSVYKLSDIPDKNETYEIECEYTGGAIPFDIFIKSFNNLYKLLLSNASYC